MIADMGGYTVAKALIDLCISLSVWIFFWIFKSLKTAKANLVVSFNRTRYSMVFIQLKFVKESGCGLRTAVSKVDLLLQIR